MMLRKKHPYERKNPAPEREDTVKTFKNHSKALSVFSFVVVAIVFLSLIFFIFVFSSIDFSMPVFILVTIAIGLLIRKKIFHLLSKLFNDPWTGLGFISFLIAGQFIVVCFLWLNMIILFAPQEERYEVLAYVANISKKRVVSYTVELEGDAYNLQPRLRTFRRPPSGKYITMRFARGIFGIRVLQDTYYSDEDY